MVYYVGLYMEFLVYVFQSETFLYYLSYYKKDSCKSRLYTGFLPRGANLEYVKKRGGARLFVAAGQPQGGGCRRGMCPLLHKMFSYLRSIYMSCDIL